MKYKDFYTNEIIDYKSNLLLKEICGNHLLVEGTLNEIDFSKVSEKVKSAIKKVGEKVDDATLPIYIASANKVKNLLQSNLSKAKDPKSNAMMKALGKVVDYIIKNPKLFVTQLRLALVVLSMVGTAVGAYASNPNPEILGNAFENQFDIVNNIDSQESIDYLNNASGEELAKKIADDVNKLGIDIDEPIIDKDVYQGPRGIAPEDMTDPAYSDLQSALKELEELKGADVVRKIENLIKLDRRLSELEFVGVNADASVTLNVSHVDKLIDTVGTDGEITGTVKYTDSNEQLDTSAALSKNGVVISEIKMKCTIKEGDSTIETKATGLVFDINDRMDQLTSDAPEDLVNRIFAGARKYGDWSKARSGDWKENLDFERMKILAGIITEENVIQKGVKAVKSIVSKGKDAFKNFLQTFKKKITHLLLSTNSIFLKPENLQKIKDGKPHKFVIKNKKIEIT